MHAMLEFVTRGLFTFIIRSVPFKSLVRTDLSATPYKKESNDRGYH